MEQGRKKSKCFRNGKVIGRRLIAFVVAFVMAIGMNVSGFIEKTEKVNAADSIKLDIGEVTINGTVGIPIEPQTIVITVENGKFDTDILYQGKDITDYFAQANIIDLSSYGKRKYAFDNLIFATGSEKYYKLPFGLKVIITETSETELICTVSGTPLLNCNKPIEVYFSNEMFSGYESYGTGYLMGTTPLAKWNVLNSDGKERYTSSVKMDKSALEGKLNGKAGETKFDIDFTLELTDAVFAFDMPKGMDVSNWFDSASAAIGAASIHLPVGLSVVVQSDIHKGDTSCVLKLTGIPKYGSTSMFRPAIPEGYVITCTRSDGAYLRYYSVTNSNGCTFNISPLENEPPYIVFRANDRILLDGYDPGSSGAGTELGSFTIFNANLKEDPSNKSTGWQAYYSNTEGKLDFEAPGFLYSSRTTLGDFVPIMVMPSGTFSQDNHSYKVICYKKDTGFVFNKLGEYDMSYYLPLKLLEGYADEAEGYTEVVKRGRLVVASPAQLAVDNVDIQTTLGKSVSELVTVKISGFSLVSFDDQLTVDTLKEKIKVSDELKAMGLDLTPVKVNKGFAVFKLSGTTVKAGEISLADCVTFDYSCFKALQGKIDTAKYDFSSMGYVSVNENCDAKLIVENKAYGIPGQEIDYSPREDVKIYPTNKSGAKVETTYINMTQEKLVTDMSIKCYSTDGGTKWKEAKSALNEKGFRKLLLKGMTFAIADKWDAKEKAPASDAVILTFPQTEKQATKPKFKIDYVTYADATGETTGQYILTDAEGTAYTAGDLRKTYEIGIASGKSLNSDGYGVWPVNGGLTIAKIESNKVQKTVYYIRTMATTTTPASKEVKISVAGQQKAPNLKIDYKKEIIKGKEGLTVRCGETYLAKNISKEDAKEAFKEISIAAYLTVGERAVFDIWQSATAKKPASAIQTINAAARAEAATSTADVVTLSKGKLALKKGYEAYDTDKQKWGGLPKIEASCVILIRKKADAKAGKENDTTYASGETMKLEVTYGVTDESKNKSGVTAAILESEKNASQSSGSGDNTSGSGGNTSGSGGNTGESGGNTQ